MNRERDPGGYWKDRGPEADALPSRNYWHRSHEPTSAEKCRESGKGRKKMPYRQILQRSLESYPGAPSVEVLNPRVG